MSHGDAAQLKRGRRWRWWARALLGLSTVILVIPPLFVEFVPDRPPLMDLPDTRLGNAVPASRFRVFVADWGYHTSVILEQTAQGFPRGPAGRERALFVEYAWGDRRFYMESDYRPHALFATLLLPTESVAYVAAWDAPPDSASRPRSLYVRTVSAAQLSALTTALERRIYHKAGGIGERVAPFPPADGYAGRFYPAYGHYLWSSACNRWMVDRLAEAGLARGGRGVIFSGQVASRLVGFRAVVSNLLPNELVAWR